jgi:hypothetical protein
VDKLFYNIINSKQEKSPTFEDYQIKVYIGKLGYDIDIDEENPKL